VLNPGILHHLKTTVLLLVFSFVILLIWGRATAADLPVAGAVPDGFRIKMLLSVQGLVSAKQGPEVLFAVDGAGRPSVLSGRRMLLLKHTDGVSGAVWHLPGSDPVDSHAWMEDGTLLVVSGHRLGAPGNKGFQVLMELPSAGMKIVPAGASRFYLFGGDTIEQRRNLYLVSKDGRLGHLLRMPGAVDAVAGDGELTFVSQGSSVYRVSPGHPPLEVYRSAGDIVSLALAGTDGLFFTNNEGAGYLSGPGRGYLFLAGTGAKLGVHGQSLYVLLPGRGVFRGEPVSAFDNLTREAEEASGTVLRADALFDQALAADRRGGYELFAIAWYRAWLAAAPRAEKGGAVRRRIAVIEADVEARVHVLLNKVAETAPVLHDQTARSKALRKIGSIMAMAGNPDGAARVVASLMSAQDRDLVRLQIAGAQAWGGDSKAALATTTRMKSAGWVGKAVMEISAAQAHSGDLADALITAKTLVDPQDRALAMTGIARAARAISNTDEAAKALQAARQAATQMSPGAIQSVVLDGIEGADQSGPLTSQSEDDVWESIAGEKLNKPVFLDFSVFWRSLRGKPADQVVNRLLGAAGEYANALALVRKTEVQWWVHRGVFAAPE